MLFKADHGWSVGLWHQRKQTSHFKLLVLKLNAMCGLPTDSAEFMEHGFLHSTTSFSPREDKHLASIVLKRQEGFASTLKPKLQVQSTRGSAAKQSVR